MSKDVCVSLADISKKYKNNVALDSISLEIARGTVTGFVGPNGAGKSTLIKLITHQLIPSSGDVNIFGQSLREEHLRLLERIGCVNEHPAFYSDLSALANLEICRMIYSGVTSEKLNEVLEFSGLMERANDKVKTFSQGMKQRLALARALLISPELLVLDEPFNGLDPEAVILFRSKLKELATGGVTVIISSHILHDIQSMADRILVFKRGRIVKDISCAEVPDTDKLEKLYFEAIGSI